MTRPKTIDTTTAGSVCFLGVGIADTAGRGPAVVWALCWVDCPIIAVVAVGTAVAAVPRSCCTELTVVGVVVATVARSCCIMVTVTSALVMVLISVTETVMDVVTVDGCKFPSVAESAPGVLGADVSFAASVALDVGMPLSSSVTLGVGRSLSIPAIPGILGVGTSLPCCEALELGTSFPIAGTLGAAVSFPAPLSLSFLGAKMDPRGPRAEREMSFMAFNY